MSCRMHQKKSNILKSCDFVSSYYIKQIMAKEKTVHSQGGTKKVKKYIEPNKLFSLG